MRNIRYLILLALGLVVLHGFASGNDFVLMHEDRGGQFVQIEN